VLPLVSSVGYAADVSQHLALCGETWRRGDRGATNDMLLQSQRRQCGAREARAAPRADFAHAEWGALRDTTQLMRAAGAGDARRVRQLIQLGAKLDLVDLTLERCAALHYSIWEGHVHVTKALLDGKYEGKGADIEKRDREGWTPLMSVFLAAPEMETRRTQLAAPSSRASAPASAAPH